MTRPTELHITIASSPETGSDDQRILEHDLRLIKAALLYGDRVTLVSLASWMGLGLYSLTALELTHLQKAQFIVTLAPGLALNNAVFEDFATRFEPFIKVLSQKKITLTRKQLRTRKELEQRLDEAWPFFQESFHQVAERFGLDELGVALESGDLELHSLPNSDETSPVMSFVDAVATYLKEGGCFPLLDEATAGLVRAAVAEGKMTPSRATTRRGRHAALAGDLIDRLPVFNAPMDEVLEIRRELATPLVRFRAAVQELSESIDAVSWDEDFGAESYAIYIKTVCPALVDLHAEIESNDYLRAVMNRFVASGTGISAALGFSALATTLPEVLKHTVLGLGLPVAAAALWRQGRNDWKEREDKITRNHYYFYYRLDTQFGSGRV